MKHLATANSQIMYSIKISGKNSLNNVETGFFV